MSKSLSAIDLYAGVGGWSLGFKMAGIEVTRSYEWWKPAAETHRANLGADVHVEDIRKLEPAKLGLAPDIIIGSPPCTQFSYSNRGGSGDVSDGLKDISKFLEFVEHFQPRHWAFENVPRVRHVLLAEMQPGGALNRFRALLENATIEVFDMADFGLPQSRKRCIAGNFDANLFRAYSSKSKRLTLGHVLQKLSASRDPLYKDRPYNKISDRELEIPLSWEEARFNKDMKVAHPIYNGMSFPERSDRASRTITATCTRVSRESLIVEGEKTGEFRRLSVRERATLQGFPVRFEFQGQSHAQKLKMVGNAVPPFFTYLLAEAFKGTNPENLVLPSDIDANALLMDPPVVKTCPDDEGKKYPENRRFRFSVPNLRFKSGTRFELNNISGKDDWRIQFYFGDSKRIREKNFTYGETLSLARDISPGLAKSLAKLRDSFSDKLPSLDSASLQSVWSGRSVGQHPFTVIDELGEIARLAIEAAPKSGDESDDLNRLAETLLYEKQTETRIGLSKIRRLSSEIVVGALMAECVNREIRTFSTKQAAA